MGNLALLLVLVAVQSAAFAVASSTRGAVLPRVLPAADVASANTLSFTASTLPPPSGRCSPGPLVDRHWFAAAYGLDAVLFTLALYAAVRLPSLPPLQEDVTRTPPGRPRRRQVPGLRSVVEGLAFIGTRPVLLLSFAVDIAAMVLAMPRALFPQAAAERFGGRAVGWLFAAIAIGSVGGRAVVGVDPAGAAAGGRARAGRRRVGPRGGGVGAGALAAGGGAPAHGRRRGRPRLGRVPADDPADLRARRDAGPPAGGVHRRRRGRPAARRPAGGRHGRGRSG